MNSEGWVSSLLVGEIKVEKGEEEMVVEEVWIEPVLSDRGSAGVGYRVRPIWPYQY